MKSTFSKRLFKVTNKANKSYLILSTDPHTASNIAVHLKIAKSISNLTVLDISDEYITPERLAAGLNYDALNDGKFFQILDGRKSTWSTYLEWINFREVKF